MYRYMENLRGSKSLISENNHGKRSTKFEGRGYSYSTSTHSFAVDTTKSWTLSMWIYVVSGSATLFYPISRITSSATNITVSITDLNSQVTLRVGGSTRLLGVNSCPVNQWNLLTFVYNEINESGIYYLNGVKFTPSQDIVFSNLQAVDTTKYTYFGTAATSPIVNTLSGYVTQLASWNRVLNSGEIYELYQNKYIDYTQNCGAYSGAQNITSYLDKHYMNCIRDVVSPGRFMYGSGMTMSTFHP